jgi:hypothetical protein
MVDPLYFQPVIIKILWHYVAVTTAELNDTFTVKALI